MANVIRNLGELVAGGENLITEFKSHQVFDKEDLRKLAEEIVALANRCGGTICVGISDDGKVEGHQFQDVNKVRERLDNLCHDRISPAISLQTELLRHPEGEVLLIDVPQRRGIPHAVFSTSTACNRTASIAICSWPG